MYTIKHNPDSNTLEVQDSNNKLYGKIYLNKGASLQELTLNGHPIIQDLSPLTYDTTYASSILFPFANRIKDGVYTFNGLDYQFDANQKEENIITEVNMETLDNIIKQNEYQSPYGIKIDTEGYELEVLKGMTESMADIDFIIAEVSVKKRFMNSYDFSELISLLSKNNFELIDILNNTIDSPRFFDCLFVNKQSFRFLSDMNKF